MDITFNIQDAKYLNNIFNNNTHIFYSFAPNLDIGDISIDSTSIQRNHQLLELLESSSDNPEYIKHFHDEWREYTICFNKLEEAINTAEDIFIWYNCTPSSICGMYYITNFFLNRKNTINIIKLPTYQIKKSVMTYCYNWEDYSFKDVDTDLFVRERTIKLPVEVVKEISTQWKKLVIENTILRVIINEKVISVDETFYDFLIMPQFTLHERKIIDIIADIIHEGLSIPQWWIERRIYYFIQNGTTVICNRGADFYHQKIMLANNGDF